MAKHKFDKDDISDLAEAVKLMTAVRNKIENDIDALQKMDDLIDPVAEMVDDIKAATVMEGN